MARQLRRIPILLAAGLLGGCASPGVETSWTDPGAAGRRLEFRKVATIAMFQDGVLRRVAEDELARAIRAGPSGIEAVPSYRSLSASALPSAEGVRSALESAGFDGAVVVRVVDSQERVTVTPGIQRWGYGPRWGTLYDPGSVRTDTIVHVETSIYSVADGKLLWSGASQTYNPRDVSDLVDDVVRDVGSTLREQGLIPEP